MNDEKLKEYETKLLDLLKDTEAQMAQSGEDRAPVAVDGRMGRVSRGDAIQVQQMAVETGRRREEKLSRVRSALGRLRDGSYGLCGRCRQPIGQARLDAMPEVVLCVRCAATPRPT